MHSFSKEPVSYQKRIFPFSGGTALGGITILNNRKKIIFTSVSICICVTCIPLILLLLIQQWKYHTLTESLNKYEAEEALYSEASLYMFAENISAGDIITNEMLTHCTLKIPKDKSICYITEKSSVVGQYAKTNYTKGMIATTDMFYQDSQRNTRYRTLDLLDIELPSSINVGELLEIRISFPNGEDYVVIRQLPVEAILTHEETAYGITVSISEEDLLRLSGARVDVNCYEGTYLYAAVYQADFDTVAEIDYPVNTDVFSLMQWDPNVVSLFTVDKEQQKRQLLEEHLQAFMQWEINDSIILEEQDYNISQES